MPGQQPQAHLALALRQLQPRLRQPVDKALLQAFPGVPLRAVLQCIDMLLQHWQQQR
ncbi:hypothetical protein D3C80_1810840 [compost metagenome]